MTDPIADLLTRLRNAQKAQHATVAIPRSSVKLGIVSILKEQGFIEGYVESTDSSQGSIKIFLRYDHQKRGTIHGLLRISKPSRRVYVRKADIPYVRDGLGVAILTTSRGLLTDRQARHAGVGGEVICHIW
jgi:small subunit ribosomal protein S8